MKKMRWTITETDNGRSFLFTKFSVIDFFLTNQRNIFMFTAEIGLWQIFQLSIFVLSHEKYYYPGQRPDFRFFFSYFVLLPLLRNFEWQCLLEIRIFLFILAAVIRENLDMRPWIDLIQLIVILNRVKIIVILYACLTRISRLFSGREIVLNHRSLYNSFFPWAFL